MNENGTGGRDVRFFGVKTKTRYSNYPLVGLFEYTMT